MATIGGGHARAVLGGAFAILTMYGLAGGVLNVTWIAINAGSGTALGTTAAVFGSMSSLGLAYFTGREVYRLCTPSTVTTVFVSTHLEAKAP
jgi:hypothetical protein